MCILWSSGVPQGKGWLGHTHSGTQVVFQGFRGLGFSSGCFWAKIVKNREGRPCSFLGWLGTGAHLCVLPSIVWEMDATVVAPRWISNGAFKAFFRRPYKSVCRIWTFYISLESSRNVKFVGPCIILIRSQKGKLYMDQWFQPPNSLLIVSYLGKPIFSMQGST